MLVESVIIGDILTTIEKENDIRPWYMHLGHMSEKELQVLHGKGMLKGNKKCKLNFYKFCIMGRQYRV